MIPTTPDKRPRLVFGFLLIAGLSVIGGTIIFIVRQPSYLKPAPPLMVTTTDTVKPGETLAKFLTLHKLEMPLVSQIQTNFSKTYDLRRLRAGALYEIVTSTDGIFFSFVYHDGPVRAYVVNRSTDGIFSVVKNETPTELKIKRIQGTVSESIYRDMMKMGYDEVFVATLVEALSDNIFGWKIDFFTEQRPGDTFDVLFEQEYIAGKPEPLRGGRLHVMAATYTGSGTRQKENLAVAFQQPGQPKEDYFDSNGNAVRRAFLRAPFSVRSFRVSSGYSRNRFHPILRVYRAHHGTDYAASIGTPVVSIGNGRVIFAGVKGGYGKCVEIRHNNKYVSRYGHLSRINVHGGETVAQGRHIGAVGNSGLSTGPHLHFEMLVDGSSRNFLRMDFPSASSVDKKNLPAFFVARDEALKRLQSTPIDSNSQTPSPKG